MISTVLISIVTEQEQFKLYTLYQLFFEINKEFAR